VDRSQSRSQSQRRHDAFADICRFGLDRNHKIVTAGGERPHITVTVPYGALTGQDAFLLPEDRLVSCGPRDDETAGL